MNHLSFFRSNTGNDQYCTYFAIGKDSTEIVCPSDFTPSVKRQKWAFSVGPDLFSSTAAEFTAAKASAVAFLNLEDPEVVHAAAIAEYEAQEEAKHYLYV